MTPRVMEALNTPPFLVERRVVVVRDAQSLLADEVADLLAWMGDPAPAVTSGRRGRRHQGPQAGQGRGEVVEVNVGSRTADRVTFVETKFAEYRVTIDHATAQQDRPTGGRRRRARRRAREDPPGDLRLGATQLGHIEPYLGDAGDVPEWDLTDASTPATPRRRSSWRVACSTRRAEPDCRSSTCSNGTTCAWPAWRAAASLGRRGRGVVGMKGFPATKACADVPAPGTERIATAVHWIADADVALKGGVSYGGRDLNTDMDVTELTVIEILVARLAKMTQGARRR